MEIKKPLCEALFNYEKEKVYPLHTPGHKGGRGMDGALLAAFGEKAWAKREIRRHRRGRAGGVRVRLRHGRFIQPPDSARRPAC